MVKQRTDLELSKPDSAGIVPDDPRLPESDPDMPFLVAGKNVPLAPQLMTTAAAAEAGKNPGKHAVGAALILMDAIGDSLNSHYYKAKVNPGFGITAEVIAHRKVEADQALADILTERARENTPEGVPSQKITAADVKKLRQVAAELGMHFIDLLAIIDCETGRQYNTGAYPLNRNKADWQRGETVGLIQWTPDGARVNQRPGESIEQTLDRLARQSFSEFPCKS